MNYLAQVNESFTDHSVMPAFPRPVVVEALSARYSDEVRIAVNESALKLDLQQFSVEDQALYRSRTIGNIATRLSFASYLPGSNKLFIDMPWDQKVETLVDASTHYTNGLVRGIEEGALQPSDLLTLQSAYDPLPNIDNTSIRSLVYNSRSYELSKNDRLAMLRSYTNTYPGSFPPHPYIVEPMGPNDSVLVQAFGRDSISDEELIDIKNKRAELANDEAMMLYLDQIHFEAGPSNNALADEVAVRLQLENPSEQIIQWEITYALRLRHPDLYDRYKNYIHTLWPHSGFYPTYEVMSDSVAIMDTIGLYAPKELAHGDMMVRAIAILNKLGVVADPIAANIPFDPGSTQPHVRNSQAWIVRETLARAEHVLKRRVKF